VATSGPSHISQQVGNNPGLVSTGPKVRLNLFLLSLRCFFGLWAAKGKDKDTSVANTAGRNVHLFIFSYLLEMNLAL
jgi:hypothetical protein